MRTVPAPTAPFSADLPPIWSGFPRATADVVPLVGFRASQLRGLARIGVRVSLVVIVVLTALAGWIGSRLDGAGVSQRADDVRAYLPAACAGLLVLLIVAAVSGGTRELLPADQAVAFPVSPTTDHLGALLMAPLNIAWLFQAWVLLGATGYATGKDAHLVAALLPMLLWMIAATALALGVAWAAEWIRRGPGGVWTFRAVAVLVSVGVAALGVVGDRDGVGTVTAWIADGAQHGADGDWLPLLAVVSALVVLIAVAIGVGAWAAHQVARRPARDEVRSDSAHRPARVNPSSDLMALIRVDRAGIWRSVPIRRGFVVLATMPGLLALAGGVHWETVSILPGPVASAAALLFGVNLWSLDGKGAMWRESLPVVPRLVFASRVIVLLELVLLGVFVTTLIAVLRAGLPSVTQLVAVLCAIVVGSFQVVSASLRWSINRPFSVDMRSARAAPAPPLVMVGYSTRLALSTTFTGSLFAVAAGGSHWYFSLVLAAFLLSFSALGLRRASRQWSDPQERSRIVTTVAS